MKLIIKVERKEMSMRLVNSAPDGRTITIPLRCRDLELAKAHWHMFGQPEVELWLTPRNAAPRRYDGDDALDLLQWRREKRLTLDMDEIRNTLRLTMQETIELEDILLDAGIENMADFATLDRPRLGEMVAQAMKLAAEVAQ